MNEDLNPFERFQRACEFLGLSADWTPRSESVPFDLLTVDARTTPDQPEILVRLSFVGDVIASLEPQPVPSPGLAENLLFHTVLPIQVRPQTRLEVAQLLMVLNALVATGNFGIDKNHQLVLSYHLLAENRQIYPLLAVRIVRMFGFFVERFRPQISAVAAGECSAFDAIAELEQELVSSATLGSKP